MNFTKWVKLCRYISNSHLSRAKIKLNIGMGIWKHIYYMHLGDRTELGKDEDGNLMERYVWRKCSQKWMDLPIELPPPIKMHIRRMITWSRKNRSGNRFLRESNFYLRMRTTR
jgi:hypothetical protein